MHYHKDTLVGGALKIEFIKKQRDWFHQNRVTEETTKKVRQTNKENEGKKRKSKK